jgi:chromosome partitioning protein
MRVMAIINQKGGCAKTTTAVNLGACLAREGRRVLVVDLDPQAHATLGFGVGRGEDRLSSYDLIMEGFGRGGPEDMLIGISERLDLIPSDVTLSTAEGLLLGRDGREHVLERALDPLRRRYDFTIIDCPPNIGVLTFNALHACTEAVIPMESGLFALHGLAKLMETIEIVNRNRTHPMDVFALATMFDGRTRIARESLEELRAHMKGRVFRTVINLNVRLKEASGYGQDILTYAPESSGARDYMALAREVLSLRRSARKDGKSSGAGYLKPVVTKDGVTFTYYSPEAASVHVVADFNNWEVDGLPMENVGGTGMWRRHVPLKKGRYEYKFYVDGRWVNDPDNPRKSRNEFGENSILEIE